MIVEGGGDGTRKSCYGQCEVCPLPDQLLIGNDKLSYVLAVCLHLVNEDEHGYAVLVEPVDKFRELPLEASRRLLLRGKLQVGREPQRRDAPTYDARSPCAEHVIAFDPQLLEDALQHVGRDDGRHCYGKAPLSSTITKFKEEDRLSRPSLAQEEACPLSASRLREQAVEEGREHLVSPDQLAGTVAKGGGEYRVSHDASRVLSFFS